MEFMYLTALLVSISGMLVLDRKYSLAFFNDARRTALTISTAMTVFIVWDLAGIALGIFRQGASPFALDFQLLPELPLEELFFLFLLCYISLLAYLWFARRRTT